MSQHIPFGLTMGLLCLGVAFVGAGLADGYIALSGKGHGDQRSVPVAGRSRPRIARSPQIF
jgi:hypothetical protein